MNMPDLAFLIQTVADIGFLLSLYAFFVERKAEKEKKYKPFCDLNETVSCTKAFTSDYGKFLGLSTALWGVFFYIGLVLLTFLHNPLYLMIAVCISIPMTLYLAYASYIKLKTFCLVCTSVYLVNIALVILGYAYLY